MTDLHGTEDVDPDTIRRHIAALEAMVAGMLPDDRALVVNMQERIEAMIAEDADALRVALMISIGRDQLRKMTGETQA